jgi:hypothetical protein
MRLALCLFLLVVPPAHAVTLQNRDWTVVLDPDTLATSARLPDGTPLTLSTADRAVVAQDLAQRGPEARWVRDDTEVTAALDERTLRLRFARRLPGRISWPRLPAAGRGLILPLGEGYYLPSDDAGWRGALVGEYDGLTTTQDLSLPVLGQDHGGSVLCVLFANPFNNELRFRAGGEGMAVTATHEFTRLDPTRPYEVEVSLDEADWLAPAKRYRRWLQASGGFVPLADKLAAAADGPRLIGASHAYVWGSRLIVPQDVRDWPALAASIPAAWLTSSEGRRACTAAGLPADHHLQRTLIDALNDALVRLAPGEDAASYRSRKEVALRTVGPALIDPSRWGDASSKVVEALLAAHLPRMWLGLPQWEAGFASPEGVAAARRAGYLIGPYDSYDTALPPGHENTGWSSAQLGQEVFERCGIVLANGRRKKGFRDAGVYTNARCVRPWLERRVTAIQQASPYNSWFLDVDASGMSFDDYDPAKPTAMAQDVANRIDNMAWIARTLGVVIGSEDGHAVANRPIAFAHGMQTRGFGWRDEDMRTSRSSAYFLGSWYPPYQPALFFKPAALKPQYRALYFDPARRLPLFRAAFHDSVITTHHWTLDSLKFTQTRVTTELLQQLYNVPPLVNLSLDSLPLRLPVLQRLDAFFRPLHERLWNQALTGFRWLDGAGLVQETRFADGTRIVANFSLRPFTLESRLLAGQSAFALLPDGRTLGFAGHALD